MKSTLHRQTFMDNYLKGKNSIQHLLRLTFDLILHILTSVLISFL